MKAGRQTTLRDQAVVTGIGVHSGLPVTLTITPHEQLKWTLTIEEIEPCPFVQAVATHFAEGLSIPFHLAGGRIRWRFVSGWLIREFEDQTERTG